MDLLYRGVETMLLICALALGMGALAVSSMPPRARPALQASVTLPMLTVMADRATP